MAKRINALSEEGLTVGGAAEWIQAKRSSTAQDNLLASRAHIH
jgi:hypothetical protein